MKDLLSNRLRERLLDVRDWAEIRPDPHWWPYATLPLVAAIGLYFTPIPAVPFLLMIALGVAAVGFALFLVGIAAWIVANCLADVTVTWMRQNLVVEQRRTQHQR
jgi:Na+/H+ antiporter NhaC